MITAIKCKCGSTKQAEIRQPDGAQHWAKLVCGQCKKYIKWVANPATAIRVKAEWDTIQHLLVGVPEYLTPWELDFVSSLADWMDEKALTPNQRTVLQEIAERVDLRDRPIF